MDPRKNRRSTRLKEENEADAEESTENTTEKVVDLLNAAMSLGRRDAEKVSKLSQVQELIVHKEPQLLDNFFDEILAFQTDTSADVRKFVVGFMEEACKKDNELVMKVIAYLKYLIPDRNVVVVKKVIQSATHLFRITLKWINDCKIIRQNHKAFWEIFLDFNNIIINQLDSMNDGIRTQTTKYVEKVVLTLSSVRKDSEIPKKEEAMMSLEEINSFHEILKKDKLREIGKQCFKKLLDFVATPAISSVNLMATLGTLTSIAKQRPQFMGTIVLAFESLHANLPPTLSKSQVTSVRKHLKMQLLNMLKHQSSIEYHPQMTNLLYDLGTSSNEIVKCMPKISSKTEAKKRQEMETNKEEKKTVKKEEPELVADIEAEEIPKPSTSKPATISAVDITASVLEPLLTPENVANLVLLSMVMLPDKMPDAFCASYTPIESAGTEDQKTHLARLLSMQMTAMGVGPGVFRAEEARHIEEAKKRKQQQKEEQKKPKQQILTVIGGTTFSKVEVAEPKPILPLQPLLSKSSIQRRIQGFKLESITQPLSLETKDRFIKLAVVRILHAERHTVMSGVHNKWKKIITSLVAQFGGELHRTLATYILEDLRSRAELAFMWLFEEFNIYLENSRRDDDLLAQENYNACLTGLMQGLLEKHTARDNLFTRLVLQAPLLTDGAINKIQDYCLQEDTKRIHHGLMLVRDLLTLRPTKKMQFLKVLLDLSTVNREYTREQAIECVIYHQKNEHLLPYIIQFACTKLDQLMLPSPPPQFYSHQDKDEKPKQMEWTESGIKQALSLFLALLPSNQKLVQKLAEVYTEANADVKRVILRLLDKPVVGMGMNSPELLLLVETCPPGAETLVTRMLHILTDKSQPTQDLVLRVRELYLKRVPDVRFLIPVLTGMEKAEVIGTLPKLIKLNAPVVKGVFHRLIVAHRSDYDNSSTNLLSPVELLVELHNITSDQVDMKSVIKATSLCFSDRSVYTSEVLVTVINCLVEQDHIPTLLMRTVIQALITYPRLSGFVMNILQRLIHKKVWLQEKVWEGFIRCCLRMRPQSYQVLLQLPGVQLQKVFKSAPELKKPLHAHVSRLTTQQRMHVAPDVWQALQHGDAAIIVPKIEPDISVKIEASESAPMYTTMAAYTIIPPGMPLPILHAVTQHPVEQRSPDHSDHTRKRDVRSHTPTQDESRESSLSPPRSKRAKEDL